MLWVDKVEFTINLQILDSLSCALFAGALFAVFFFLDYCHAPPVSIVKSCLDARSIAPER